jgi:hypothetical protein
MLGKAILALFAVTVIGLAATTGALARGGGSGDYLPAVGYPLLFSFSSERICHPVRRRVLTRQLERGRPGSRPLGHY